MRPGLENLLTLLGGRSEMQSLDCAAWQQIFDLAEEEHVLPWVAHLCSADVTIPSEVRQKLRTIEREAAIAGFYWVSELAHILGPFAKAGIKVVPLKGPFLGERLYGDAAWRTNYDLDILVPKTELAQSEAVLVSLGFRPGMPDDYHRQWYRGPTTVELHFDVENPLAFKYDTAGALDRAQPTLFHGQSCWRLDPGDELVFLCLHAVRHRFERLSVILDLCIAFRKLSLPESLDGSEQDTDESRLLTLGLAMARRLQNDTKPESPIHGSVTQTEHLERLADRLWNELTTERSKPLDWRGVHSFYLDMEIPGRRMPRRMRHLRILLQRVIAPDYEFAAKFGVHRTWQVRLLRPLRILSTALRTAAASEEDA